jgi:hypothetical protein
MVASAQLFLVTFKKCLKFTLAISIKCLCSIDWDALS